MQIDAQVKSISDINQFFIVPDYQREYVWKANDQVKQFITDIDNAFETSNNDHLKLLFCVNMLNEGLHVNDIDGVIMLRPTISPIIYLQQLGRALSVGHNEHPLIFDIVNNSLGIKDIDKFYEQETELMAKND